jgi:hypothetical protein
MNSDESRQSLAAEHDVGPPVGDGGIALEWEGRQRELIEAVCAGWEPILRRRGIIRSDELAAARAGDVEAALTCRQRLRLEVMLRPAAEHVEAVLEPIDLAVHAYVDFVHGDLDDAAIAMRRAIVTNGRVAERFGLAGRHALQLHLTSNLVKVMLRRGDVDQAIAVADAVIATEGDPSAWPFEDGPIDPWKELPDVVREVLRAQIVRQSAPVSAR